MKNCNKVLKFNPLHSGNIMEECRVTCLLVPAHPFQQVVGELALLSNMWWQDRAEDGHGHQVRAGHVQVGCPELPILHREECPCPVSSVQCRHSQWRVIQSQQSIVATQLELLTSILSENRYYGFPSEYINIQVESNDNCVNKEPV